MCVELARGAPHPGGGGGFLRHQSISFARPLRSRAARRGGDARPRHTAAARQHGACAGAWRRKTSTGVKGCHTVRVVHRGASARGTSRRTRVKRERQRSAARAASRRQAARCASLLRGAAPQARRASRDAATRRRVRAAACCGAMRGGARNRTSEGAGTVVTARREAHARTRDTVRQSAGCGSGLRLLASDAPPPGAPLS
jgi:hypothetical protein